MPDRDITRRGRLISHCCPPAQASGSTDIDFVDQFTGSGQ
jgi:hypothetical protein